MVTKILYYYSKVQCLPLSKIKYMNVLKIMFKNNNKTIKCWINYGFKVSSLCVFQNMSKISIQYLQIRNIF